MTYSSLWADLGTIMMDGIVDLSSGSVELDLVNSTSNLVIIKPGQIVVTAIQVTLSKYCQTLNQAMINQYCRLNLSSVLLRKRTTFCTLASCQTK